MGVKHNWQQIDGACLRALNDPSFVPKATRSPDPRFGYFMTTELCHLSCVMCHFNGPKAARHGAETLDSSIVDKVLRSRPQREKIWFVSTGEFFSDPNALSYLRRASDLGLSPRVITHGQLLAPAFIDQVLAAGVKEILLSVDSIDADQYAKIRRGGCLDVILDACRYLQERKHAGAEVTVGVSIICFPANKHGKDEVIAFWRERVDYVQFVSEYYDVFRLRRLFFIPERRTDCSLELIPLPSGRVAPCCAIAIYSHDHDVSWLPHLADVSQKEAYETLCDMYEDPNSKLASLCANCDWWTQFHTNEHGHTPIYEVVNFNREAPPVTAASTSIASSDC
jgi:Radical SAM superfamily